MADEDYIGFIPARAGSERVVGKNTRPFAGFEKGLLELKLRQMAKVTGLSRIVVSSNDDEVLSISADFARTLDSRIQPLERPNEWGSSATSMGLFISDYIAHLFEQGTIVWTHVTSPLITAAVYQDIIGAYEAAKSEGCDSLITVTKLQKFIWNREGPVNYDPKVEKWPRSQDLEPLFEINHGVYMMPFALMRERQDRIGHKPKFYELPETIAMDIDWPEQFTHLEHLVVERVAKGEAL